MVDRNRTYDPDLSPDRYYNKQVRAHLIYSDLEDAKTIARKMTNAWVSVFAKFFNQVHADLSWQAGVKSMMSAGMKGGLAVRYANYFLSSYLFTGKVSYEAYKSKVSKEIFSEPVIIYLASITSCTTIKNKDVETFLVSQNPKLSKELTNLCPELRYDYYRDLDFTGSFDSAFAQYQMPEIPRSFLYYYVSGISAQKQSTSGSQGGEASSPEGASVVSVNPNNVVEELRAVVHKFAYGR